MLVRSLGEYNGLAKAFTEILGALHKNIHTSPVARRSSGFAISYQSFSFRHYHPGDSVICILFRRRPKINKLKIRLCHIFILSTSYTSTPKLVAFASGNPCILAPKLIAFVSGNPCIAERENKSISTEMSSLFLFI